MEENSQNHNINEETEPQATSFDPNERKLARRLRIQRRAEALRRCICNFIMDRKLKQRANIKLCILLGKSGTNPFLMVHHAYGNEAMSRPVCFERRSCFRRSRTPLRDKERQQMQVGQETVEEVEKTQVEQQVETSNKDLQTLVSEGLELVTNVRIANDAREVKRREENVAAHKERMTKLDQELVAGAQKLEEINARWEGILETNDPLDLYHDIHHQRVKCSELMSQKDQLIQELRKELHLADDRFMRDQRRQKQDLGLLCERIDQQVVVMSRAYKQELLLVEVGNGTGATAGRGG
uniref:Dynein regulatory complex protein 1/2 N-terminal domain-containing protein n=1 Tax=Timema bartmani TaxID=61472 RepID=A0A7R9F6V1_9NEOP|nr:unnamed protein product [Timema bartmani]